jgi:carbon-monoxide dehydrogenase medium subunit
MIPTAFSYERATSLNDAVARLAGGGKILAGGHSLLPLMKLRLSEPQRLIDIARIPELAGIHEKDGTIVIGAATTHHALVTSNVLAERCPVLPEAAATIGDAQVRNRGTIGGSLAHADPSADYPAVMLALGAELHLVGPKGERAVRAEDFFKDLFTVDLAADEIIAAVHLKPVRMAAYAKLSQRASHYAIVGVAASLTLEGGAIASARIGLTGATSHAHRLTGVEKALAGRPANEQTIAAAARTAGAALLNVNADIHASEEYRRAMVGVFVGRALRAAIARRE